MNDNIAIKVENVSKAFKLPHEKSGSIKSALLGWRKRKKGYENQQVLKDVSFEIKKGEFYGIVGRNGSGKSTLLKLISQIYTPDSGSITVNGKLTPFIELGVGFNPELSGRDNVYLNGALLGFNRDEMDAMYDEIVEFAELERFMDQKLKNYSSGMQVRLAFSIAIRADTDVLVLDEVLAVGDEAFQRKCFEYFAKLKRDKKTVILVTHSMDNVTRFCTQAFMLEDGRIVENKSVKSVAERYIKVNTDSIVTQTDKDESSAEDTEKNSNQYADVRLDIMDAELKNKNIFTSKKQDNIINIRATLKIKCDIGKKVFISILIKNEHGQPIVRISSEMLGDNTVTHSPRKGDKIVLESKIQNIFGEGKYFVGVSFKSVDRSEVYIESKDKAVFSVAGLGANGYSLRPDNMTVLEKL